MKQTVDLGKYNNEWYNTNAGAVKRTVWYFVNAIIFNSGLFPLNGLKKSLLKAFGCKVGTKVVIKPNVNIKYPWLLKIGDNSWIGENVWIDNLTHVTIESDVCISQGAMILCGNHNYKSVSFDLIVKPITLKKGCWVGARSIVCPGVTLNINSILTVGSIANNDLDEDMIYTGNPAKPIRKRVFDEQG